VQVQRDLEEFENRDARLVAIGMGTGAEAAGMAERLELGFPLLGDPGHEAYKAFGLARDGWYGLLVRPFLAHPLRATRDIADADLKASASPRSDVQRLGGVAIVDRAGTLRYLRRAERSDDLPPNAELLAALDRL
jgi:hypothetical protein